MASDNVSMRDFGEQLKRARLQQSRSLDDLAAQTKIHRRHLEAIEAGEIGHLPEGPYVKAFVREYSRALGLKVPDEFAVPSAEEKPSAKDPKVVSRPAKSDIVTQEDSMLPISAVAKETVRFANTAVNSAVRSVAKTTEKVVDFVESGSKEAIEVLTSKTLWDEADQVRRERLGLEPLEESQVAAKKPVHAAVNPVEADPVSSRMHQSIDAEEYVSTRSSRSREPRVSSRGATNVIIALLVVLFAGAVFYAIRTYKRETGSTTAGKDYVPAPLDKPNIPAAPAKTTSAANPPMTAPAAVGPQDSLRFRIRATGPVWVSIAPDGIPAYRGELKTGETRTFTAGQRIIVNIGNQKAIDMTLDGRPLTNLPTIPNSGVVVRDLVLTKGRAELGGKSIELNGISAAAASTPQAPIAPPTTANNSAKPSVSGHSSATSTSKPASKPTTSSTSTKSTGVKSSTSTTTPKSTTRNPAPAKLTTPKPAATTPPVDSPASHFLKSPPASTIPKPKLPNSPTQQYRNSASDRRKSGLKIPISPVQPVPGRP
jgi:hypothetical protein